MTVLDGLLRGVTAAFVARATRMAVNGALLIVLVRFVLSPVVYGLFTVTLAIVGAAKLFADLGVARSTARCLTEYTESRPDQLPHVLRVGFEMRVALATIVTGALSVRVLAAAIR